MTNSATEAATVMMTRQTTATIQPTLISQHPQNKNRRFLTILLYSNKTFKLLRIIFRSKYILVETDNTQSNNKLQPLLSVSVNTAIRMQHRAVIVRRVETIR